MSNKHPRPVLHRRDHERGGADPVRLIWDDEPGGVTPPPTTDLIAYWRMGAASGDQPETSGYLTPVPLGLISGATAATWNVTGAVPADDGAFQFNYNGGTSGGDRYQVSDGRWEFLGNLAFTVVLWIKQRSSWVSAGGSGNFFGVVGTAQWHQQGWAVFVQSNTGGNTITCQRAGGSANDFVTAALSYDTWTHVAFVYDGTEMRLYIDGSNVDSVTSSLAMTGLDVLNVGWTDAWGINGYLYAILDEVAIYKAALTDPQIAALAAGALPA